MAEISEQIKAIEEQIIFAAKEEIFHIQNWSALLKKLMYLQKAENLKEQDLQTIESNKLCILQAIEVHLNKEKNLGQPMKAKRLSIFKKITLTSTLFFHSLVSGFSGFITCKSLLVLFLSAANPYMLVASLLVGAVELMLFVFSDARELCNAHGVSLLQARSRLDILKCQLETTQKIHKAIYRENGNKLDLKPYQESMGLMHADMKEKNAYLDKKTKPTILRRSFKIIGQLISGSVAMGAGVLIAKCVIGLCAAALLATPIGGILCGISALLSLSVFYFVRAKSISGAIDKVLGQPRKFKTDLRNFITEDVGRFNHKMAGILSKRHLRNAGVQRLKYKVKCIEATNKTCRKIIYNTHDFSSRFFSPKKKLRKKNLLNASPVIHKTRLA
jgi:hypothetical protein